MTLRLLTLLLCAVCSLRAAPASAYDLLATAPPETVQLLATVGEPDEHGRVGYHRQHGRWYQVGLQRAGCWYMIAGIMAGDRERVDLAWRAVDLAFAHQVEDGGFLSVKRPDRREHDFDQRIETTYFFMQELGHALLLLQQSPLEPEYRERIAALRPGLQHAMEFLLSGLAGIEAKVGHTANRLLIAAKAFALNGVLLEDERFQEAARYLIGVALERRDEDGVFFEGGGRDSSYNAVCLLMAQVIDLFMPDPRIAAAMRPAMAWQLTRIHPDGEVSIEGNTRTGTGAERNRQGGVKTVNYREVGLALLYYGLREDEPELVALAGRVGAHRAAQELAAEGPVPLHRRPDILLILADDLGFSDLGAFGGEIPTPHLDALAAAGVRFTQFYNSARCSPTRAALLTGLYPHEAGMGVLAENASRRAEPDVGPGYQQHLAEDAVVISEVLVNWGYRTGLFGKWHLGYHGEERRPLARGFERFYGILEGSASYHRPAPPRARTRQTEELPPPEELDYYFTDALTDEALAFLRGLAPGEKFFVFLSHTAPHWPLHARNEDVEKFRDHYLVGWDELRVRRHARVLELGLLPPDTPLPPREAGVRAWAELTPAEQQDLAYRMAVYAAQVYRLDLNVGRVIAHLRDTGRLENTLVLFLSDNGASAEPGTDAGGGAPAAVNRPEAFGLGTRNPMGGSSYGAGWAHLSNAPFRRYKSDLEEGGIRTPAIWHWPEGPGAAARRAETTPVHVIDFVPTIIEAVGLIYPTQRRGEATRPLRGRSLLPLLGGQTWSRDEPLFWEQYGQRAVRQGAWKALSTRDEEPTWALFDLGADPTEQVDRSAEHPAIKDELVRAWWSWAEQARVLPAPLP
jgi:arylsulfatase A-like enzyme